MLKDSILGYLLAGVVGLGLVTLVSLKFYSDAREEIGYLKEECNSRVLKNVAEAEQETRRLIQESLLQRVEASERRAEMDREMAERLRETLLNRNKELDDVKRRLSAAARKEVEAGDPCLDRSIPAPVWSGLLNDQGSD